MTTTSNTETVTYRPEIDGLRTIAIVPVILFHLGWSWIPGGFVGVDVFFVISGYLITSIIMRQLAAGTFTFRGFWGRRVRRIVPALSLMVVSVLVATIVAAPRYDWQWTGQQAIATMLSFANEFLRRNAGDYWGSGAEQSPFLHAWSLSVEEQFYLLYPALVWGIHRFRPRWLPATMVVATTASFGAFLWAVHHKPSAAFYLLPFRAWELGVGCVLGVTHSPPPERAAHRVPSGMLAILGLAVILVSCFLARRTGAVLALPVAGAALVIACGRSGLCRRILSHKVMIHLGRLSYSLYLWHWPVIMAMRRIDDRWPSLTSSMFCGVATYALAAVTHQLVENPARRRAHATPWILATAGIILSLALWMASKPYFYPMSAFDDIVYAVHNCHPANPPYDHNPRSFATTVVDNGNWTPDAYRTEGIRVGDKDRPPDIVVIGDSHGCMWSSAIRSAAESLGLSVAFFVIDGASPFMEMPPTGREGGWGMTTVERLEFDRARLRCIEKWKPPVVIIGALWTTESVREARDLLDFIAAQGSRVLLIEDPPILTIGNINTGQWLASRGIVPREGREAFAPFRNLEPSAGGRTAVRTLAATRNKVSFVPAWDLFATDDGVVVLDGRSVLYLDDDHLTVAGAKRIVPRLRDWLIEHVPAAIDPCPEVDARP